jgi:hypothetical protein
VFLINNVALPAFNHYRVLSLPLASGVVLQVDQASMRIKSFVGTSENGGEDPGVDRRERLTPATRACSWQSCQAWMPLCMKPYRAVNSIN